MEGSVALRLGVSSGRGEWGGRQGDPLCGALASAAGFWRESVPPFPFSTSCSDSLGGTEGEGAVAWAGIGGGGGGGGGGDGVGDDGVG